MASVPDAFDAAHPPVSASVSVLVADAEDSARELATLLRDAGYATEICGSPARLKRLLRERDFAILLCDPEASGCDPFAEIADLNPRPALIQLAGFGSVDEAVDAVRRGAFDYLCKPVSEEQVLVSITRALEQRRLRAENVTLQARLSERFELGNVVSRDPKVQRILAAVDAIADTRATILIEGESGTGKTLIARTIHQRSTRAKGPFVEVNCGALPESLLESELFGHMRGAFTGAVKDRPGKFEAADGGTLFLDEIGTASPDLQVKLLRVLQDRAFERLGDTKTRTCDVRVVAATNAKLEESVKQGKFREDLYWRLRVVAFELPPLRERPGDVPLLAERFVARFAAEHGRPSKRIGSAALAALVGHTWPGNVRELEHCLERAVLLAAGETIEPLDLGFSTPRLNSALSALGGESQSDMSLGNPSQGSRSSIRSDSRPGDAIADAAGGTPNSALPTFVQGTTLRQALEGPEREIIEQALRACGGNRKETARLLDVNRTTLFNKMKKYNLMEFPLRSE